MTTQNIDRCRTLVGHAATFRWRSSVLRVRRSGTRSLFVVALIAVATACANTPTTFPSSAETPAQATQSAGSSSSASTATPTRAAYQLGTGDQLRIIVFGEEDLSGEFQVDDTGAVSIPLVGDVTARGQTLRSFEAAVREKLTEGYLKDPRVSVQVLNYRPFYIIGEVENDGEYPFVSGMHVLNAVAVAGGFTYRANTSKVFITRGDQEYEFIVKPDLRLEPGDVIRVPERFF
jgi:protein involved in polysaccharide export with SLBB domain